MIIQKTIKIDDASEIPLIISSYKSQINELLQSKEFINYIAKIVSNHVNQIASEEVGTIGSDVLSSEEINTYLESFDSSIEENSFSIFNDAEVDINSKNMSETTRSNYADGLSLSQLIEYGFGYTGYLNTEPLPDASTWQYDINMHGYKGWYYKDQNGQVHWTNGMEGRLVFLKIMYWVEENLPTLVEKFLKKNVKD